jgi:tetratricopeptide (TPR) repeat protein
LQQSRVHHAFAEQQHAAGKLNLAIDEIIRALNIAEAIRNRPLQAEYYYFLANIFFEMREPQKFMFYSDKGYQISVQLKNGELTARNRLNIAIGHILSNQYDLALTHLLSVERVFTREKEPHLLASTYLQLGHAYYLKGRYTTSLYHLKKVETLYPKLPRRKIMKLHVEGAMMENYIKLEHYDQAKFYFDNNLNLAIEYMDANDVREFYLLGAGIYEHLGEYQIALSLLRNHKRISDSVTNVAMRKAIHDTEIKFQTAKKEKAITDQKLQLINKDLELQKKNKYLVYVIVAIVLLLLSSAIAYLAYRNKTQAIELSLLKAQIHPHFLFNTLNNLYALTLAKADEAPTVVLGLSSILRYILYECNTLKVDLKKEMQVISEYISLERIRYSQSLEVNMLIKQDFGSRQIAPLLILPLVENAFKHGVAKLMDEAWINVEAYIKEERFVFKISNNRPPREEIKRYAEHHGNIGLVNIKKRLDILYPKRHKFKITSSEDVFIVTMELKLQ